MVKSILTLPCSVRYWFESSECFYGEVSIDSTMQSGIDPKVRNISMVKSVLTSLCSVKYWSNTSEHLYGEVSIDFTMQRKVLIRKFRTFLWWTQYWLYHAALSIDPKVLIISMVKSVLTSPCSVKYWSESCELFYGEVSIDFTMQR